MPKFKRRILDAAASGYGWLGAETPIGVVFCVGGIYKATHHEIEVGLSEAARGFKEQLDDITRRLYRPP